jgi:hypothetical protein
MHRDPLPTISPSRWPHAWKSACAIGIAVGLWSSPAGSQVFLIPGQNPLTDAEEIELVYAGAQSIPQIIVRGPQPANSFVLSSYHSPDGQLDRIFSGLVIHDLPGYLALQH